jgi:hypothetical protein
MSIVKRTTLPNGGRLLEYDNGDKGWYLNGEFHREDGPAFEYADGDKFWYINDKFHRLDGPACEFTEDGKDCKVWYINGQHIPCATQEEFERLMRLKAFW